jgi:hypothetical protein
MAAWRRFVLCVRSLLAHDAAPLWQAVLAEAATYVLKADKRGASITHAAIAGIIPPNFPIHSPGWFCFFPISGRKSPNNSAMKSPKKRLWSYLVINGSDHG